MSLELSDHLNLSQSIWYSLSIPPRYWLSIWVWLSIWRQTHISLLYWAVRVRPEPSWANPFCSLSNASGICPVNTTHLPNVWPMLGQRRRRWANIGQTLGRCVVFAVWGNSRDFRAICTNRVFFPLVKCKLLNKYDTSNYVFTQN